VDVGNTNPTSTTAIKEPAMLPTRQDQRLVTASCRRDNLVAPAEFDVHVRLPAFLLNGSMPGRAVAGSGSIDR
jgi:hypothetical protein